MVQTHFSSYTAMMSDYSEPMINQLMQTAVILIDDGFRIQWVNDAAEALLGQSLRRLNEHNISDVLIAGDVTEALLAHCFEQKGQWQLEEATLVTAQDEWRDCSVSLNYQHLEQQPVILIEIMCARDQLGIKKEYQLLDQNKVSLSMVRNLAHEIKNPLSGLRGAAQLLSRKVPETLQRFTDVIVAEADRLQQLVDRMLTPAKVEPRQQMNVHELTERAINFIQLQPQSAITLIRDYDPSLPELFVAKEQVYQALLNLLNNACEALSQSGSIILRTRAVHQHSIGPKQYRLMARIDVEDNGPGISDELKDVIFFPTISGKQSSGLGLGIAQSLIRQNDGIIEFESAAGKTCFSIFLPISVLQKEQDDE
ncbi:MAG: PAS domain-containing protein [Gammaproteobacteria bacterium]|nr:PAS domain-containing protein [Gammaproteobacteria bacterium]